MLPSHREGRRRVVEPKPRKKLYSLRALNPQMLEVDSIRRTKDVFKELERSLERENKEEQPVAEPVLVLPEDEKQIEDDSFWQKFKVETDKVAEKVVSERVNCYQREFLKIKKEFESHENTRKRQIQGLQNAVKEKYKEIHGYFEELKQQKQAVVMNNPISKGKRNRKSQPILLLYENNAKIITLQDSIESLRKEVQELEREVSFLSIKEKHFKKQWIYFLRKMLSEGYYLRKGVIPILQEMVAVSYVPKMSDMPHCLDQVSKNCLLQEYELLRSAKPQQSPKRVTSEPKSRTTGLAEKELMRDIYKQTKQLMSVLVKQSQWKSKLVLPPIVHVSKQLVRQDWRLNERRRLSHVYTGERYNLSRSILFGPKVETCF